MIRIVWLFLLVIFSNHSWSFKVSPMVQSFSPQGSGATQNFVIENTTEADIAVEVIGKKRGFDDKGIEKRSDTENLSIYPPQFSLKPQQKRLVRISYTGPIELNNEEAYRIIFQQLPVTLPSSRNQEEPTGINLNFMLRYVASIYITPQGVNSRVTTHDPQFKENHFEVLFENKGSAHQVLSRSELRLVNAEDSTEVFLIPTEESEKVLGAENLLPGMKKIYTFPKPKDIETKKKWTVEVKIDSSL